MISEYDEINVAILASACEKAVETAYQSSYEAKRKGMILTSQGRCQKELMTLL